MSAQAISRPTNVSVQTCEGGLPAAWDHYVYQHPRSSFFHLAGWQRVVERIFGFQSRCLVANEAGCIRGVLPLFLVRNILQGRSLISTPFAVYGGICADDEGAENVLRQAACEMAKAERVQYLELREPWPIYRYGFHTKQLYVTFDQELPQDAEQLLRGFPRDTRYMIRKAQKNGLHAVIDNQQLDIFYQIYAQSVHNLGTPVFSKTYFRTLQDEFGKQCEITIVSHRAQAVAGVLSFRFGDWILPYYGGSVQEGRHLAANNFMYWEVMKQAIANGVRYFDFGRSKLGSGSYAFKTQWNMRERPLPYQFFLVGRESMPNYSPANSRFKLATSIWKHVPFSVSKILGPVLVRLFP